MGAAAESHDQLIQLINYDEDDSDEIDGDMEEQVTMMFSLLEFLLARVTINHYW